MHPPTERPNELRNHVSAFVPARVRLNTVPGTTRQHADRPMTALPSSGTLSRVLLAPLLSDMRRLNHLVDFHQAPEITPEASVLTELAFVR
jgi:hypothetical protein